MKGLMTLLLLLVLGANCGCLAVKLNGFQEIAEKNPVGMEEATATPEGAALIRDLGNYISELEYRLEKGD
jgi:hypothetical protein